MKEIELVALLTGLTVEKINNLGGLMGEPNYMALLEDRARRHAEVKLLLDDVKAGKLTAEQAWGLWTDIRARKRK